MPDAAVDSAPPCARRVACWLLLQSAWFVALLMAAGAILRVVAFDDSAVSVAVGAYSFWLYLPSYILFAFGVASRRRLLTVLAALIVACHVVWVWPSTGTAVTIPDAARQAPRFVLFSANVNFENPIPLKLLQELRRIDPDVVALQEVTPAWVERLRATGLLRRYPYRVIAPASGPNGTALLSRVPLGDAAILTTLGDRMAMATLTIGGRTVRLMAVHPTAPTDFDRWNTQRRAVTRAVATESRPIVLAGDFNSTQFNGWLDQLEALGVDSAHELLGRGFATTWPNRARWWPPIRLDHVLVSPSLVPLSISEGRGAGSDHRPVIVELALVPPPPRSEG